MVDGQLSEYLMSGVVPAVGNHFVGKHTNQTTFVILPSLILLQFQRFFTIGKHPSEYKFVTYLFDFLEMLGWDVGIIFLNFEFRRKTLNWNKVIELKHIKTYDPVPSGINYTSCNIYSLCDLWETEINNGLMYETLVRE